MTAGEAERLLDDLSRAGDIVTDQAILESYRRDQSPPGVAPAGTPLALSRPTTTAEVQAVVDAAGRHRIPIVPRGAGSGLSGGANAIDGCLILSLERMTALSIDKDSLTATVQPGVINMALASAARGEDLWYAPDPASWEFSTIGGNVATNAGGLCCVKYGVTRDALLGLEVVLADGSAVRLGGSTRKSVAGYDLVGLLCGSEGTLGVITEATLRLRPRPKVAGTLTASFSSLAQAGRAIERIVQSFTPSLLELMDASTVAAVEAMAPMDLDGTVALLFARSDSGPADGFGDVKRMAAFCESAGASLVAVSDEEAEGRALMAARRLAYPALERQGATLLDDVCVPLGAIVPLIEGVEGIAARQGLTIGVFGHAGDGNMHPTIVYDPRDEDATRRALVAFAEIIDLALRLGGTVTGEHGVGTLKRDVLKAELGEALDLHRSVKRALDPRGLLNPGKAI